MPRPKKTELSKAVNPGTKRGNPDFVSSSFYVPKKVNLRFDKAILTLKSNGFEVDRSDILCVLMDRFNESVEAAEKQDEGEGLNLEAILAENPSGTVVETAGLTLLKKEMKGQGDKLKGVYKQLEEVSSRLEVLRDKELQLVGQLGEKMLAYVPEDDQDRAAFEKLVERLKQDHGGSSDQAG
ncbi:hypothetical protein N9T98_00015 [bacterium]|nr:hypothetical protein [bacterium]